MRRSIVLAMILVSQAAWGEDAAPAAARNWSINGFAAQGYINTNGNNFYGESRGGGSFDYYELGLIGAIQMTERLSAAGQVLVRKAGETDDGDLRLDYGFLDYRVAALESASAGVRLGRVRNPLGFYNETRDVIFTRPSILLPQSVYLEGTGVREILFSSDAIQFYGDWDEAEHHTGIKLSFGESSEVSRETKENFLGGTALPPGFQLKSLRLEDPIFGQVIHERNGGRLRFALSYLSAHLAGTFTAPIPVPPVTLDTEIATFSAQYNLERFTWTSEVSMSSIDGDALGMSTDSTSYAGYLQGQYRFAPTWTGLVRYDTGEENDGARPRDVTAGLRWQPLPNWVVMGEYHDIKGTNGIPQPDNQGRTLSDKTDLFALMVGFRF